MAEFITSDHLQSLIKPSIFPFLDHVFDDQSMEDITQFSGINPITTSPITTTTTTTNTTTNNNVNDNSTLMNFQSFVPFSSDNFFPNPATATTDHHHLMMISPNLAQTFQGNNLNSSVSQKPIVVNNNNNNEDDNNNYYYSHESKKRKALNFDASESSSGMSSPPVSESGNNKTKNGLGKGKRVKSNNNEREEEKLKDVVHVRARRGQATDSHSLAERVRRGKINERLKCLQDIVPGCYKTMGMAVMLDEIINYVQSLQNQVEFLSMKLTAASTFYDFNSETDAVEKLQRAKANEAKEMERLIREGYGGFACFHSNWPL